MTAKSAALLIGIIFIAVGLIGFIDNPIVYNSEKAIFHADTAHNYVHIVSGVLFVFVALASPAFAKTFMVLFGAVYLGLGIWGALTVGSESMTTLLGFLHVNTNDNYLHIGLGVVILLLGLASRRAVTA